MKECSKCHEVKPFSAFYLLYGTPRPHCKVCHKAQSKTYHLAHPDQIKAIKAKYRQQHAERKRNCDAEYRASNKKRVSQSQRACYVRHTDRYALRARRWRQNNPDLVIMYAARRRARVRGSEGSYTPQEWQDLKALCDYRCVRCGRREPSIKLTVDHVLPIVCGGSNTIDNIQPLCKSCNSRKGTRHIDYRLRTHARRIQSAR